MLSSSKSLRPVAASFCAWVTPPLPPPTFEIRHNANNDLCEAFFTKELRFDISKLIEEGETEFVLIAKSTDGGTYNKVFKLIVED